jgi:hypothetical protein
MSDKPPIAIVGMHRSGTSMITRALHESGLRLVGTDGDELIEPAEDNPEGFWENKAIVACNDELLEAAGGAWDNPPVLPPVAVDDPRVAHVAEAATAALGPLREHDQWGFKDPRTCLTAAYWLDLEPDLSFIICVRHPVEVAMSLKRRNQNSYSLGLALWERYYATLLEQVSPERRTVTHYDTFFLDPEAEMARVCAFAGLEPAPPPVRRDLRHHATDVDLGDAGTSDGLRSLYDRLCREAGTPPPRPAPADAGHVRRLILDGAVAQRQADQRQAAIERLQEREDEFRAAHARAEADLRSRIRALEAEVTAARLAALETTTARALDELSSSTARALDELSSSVDRIDRRTRDTAARLEASPLRDTAVRAARAGARRLPAPAQHALRTNRVRAQRLVAQPGPTARAVKQRLRRQASVQARHLPPPARHALRRGRSVYRRAATAPLPTAKAGVRRLPDPAQRAAQRAWQVAEPLGRAGAQYIAARRPGARSVVDPFPKPAPTPKGPAPRLWKDAYRRVVQQAWSDPEPWLVVAPGSPADVAQARRPRATPFPDTRGGKPLADDLAHIAHLEAQRYAGHRHLVLPEGSRPWFRQQTELRDHVVWTYCTVVDEPDAGAVFDLGQAPGPELRSLRAAVGQLAAGLGQPPAVLNCTSVDLDAELPGHATFSPPTTGGRLPYLDGSVDVVVVDADHDDLAEARRVAGLGVITVAVGGAGPVVRSVEGSARPAAPPPRVMVWSSPVPDVRWEPALADRVERAGAHLLLAPLDADHLGALDDHDVVVAVEPHALPLPGTIEAAAAAALTDPGTAVAGKVLQADGRLESAGGTVFFDRSVALIAASSPHVRAPWHEYVRPVCWAPGLIAAAAALWAGIPGPAALEGRAYVREWCAALWASGHSVAYHPNVAAVRVDDDGGEPSVPLTASAWQRVLDLRPRRPRELSDGAWRHLLAHDDVEACRG